MAIAEVQKNHPTSASGTTITVTFTAPTSGNLLVVALVAIGAGTVGFNTPSGWNAARVGAEAAVFWKISNGTETSTNFTYTLAGGLRGWAVELSGAHASAPFDTSGYGSFASGSVAACVTDAALAVNNEYAIAMTGLNGTNGGAESASNSFTLLGTGNTRDVGASRILTGGSGATIATNLGWSTSRAGRWIIASFKPAIPLVTGAATLAATSALNVARSYPFPMSGLIAWADFSEKGSLWADTSQSVLAAADAAVASVGDRRVPIYPLPNASGESGFGFPFWYANWSGGADPGVAVAQVADGTAPFGSFVATVSQNNAVANSYPAVMMGRNDTAPYIALKPGTLYRVTAYVKASRADQQVELFGGGYDSSGADVFDYPSEGLQTMQPGDGWVRRSMLWQTKTTTTRAVIGVRGLSTTSTGEMFRVDAWQIEEAADKARPFFTGTWNGIQQATAGSQPVRKDAIVNGLSVGRFDAVDDWMQALDTTALTTNDFTMFVVFRPLSSTNTGYVAQMTSGNSRYAFITAYTAGKTEWFDQAGTRTVLGDTDLTNFHIAAVRHPASGNVLAYQDGVAATPFAVAASQAATRRIKLAMSDGTLANDVWGGDLGEVIAFDRVLTPTETNKVARYLADKWGLSWTDISGAATVTGSATLPATGGMTVAGKQGFKGAATLPAAGSLSAVGKRYAYSSATLPAVGAASVSNAAKRTAKSAATLPAVGSATVAGKRIQKGAATLPGVGGLIADGQVTQPGPKTVVGAANLSGLGSISVTGKRGQYASGTLPAVGAMTVAGKRISYGVATLPGVGAATVTGKTTRKGAGALSGVGALSGAGTRRQKAAGALSGQGGLVGTGYVPFVPPPVWSSADYRLDLYDMSHTLVRSDVLAVDFSPDLSYSYSLNGPGAISWQLPIRGPGVTQANFLVGQRTIELYRNDVLVWAGYLLDAQGQGSWVTFSGRGWYEGLRRRLIDTNHHYYGVEALDIAWDLIAYTQGKSSLGITRDPLEVASGKNRYRDYCCDDFTLVSEAIEDLAGLNLGFDFWITPQKVWKTKSPRRGTDLTGAVILDAQKNVTSLSYGLATEDMATEVFYVGPNVDECRDLDSLPSSTGLATYGRQELGVDMTNIKKDTERDEYAAELLRYQSVPLAQATALVPGELGIVPGVFDLGDRVRVKSADGWMTFDQTMRVIDYSVHVGLDCVEEMTVQLDSVYV